MLAAFHRPAPDSARGCPGLDFSLLAVESVEADQASGPRRCLPAVVDRLYEMLSGCGRLLADVRGIGVGVPGSVDLSRGAMVLGRAPVLGRCGTGAAVPARP